LFVYLFINLQSKLYYVTSVRTCLCSCFIATRLWKFPLFFCNKRPLAQYRGVQKWCFSLLSPWRETLDIVSRAQGSRRSLQK